MLAFHLCKSNQLLVYFSEGAHNGIAEIFKAQMHKMLFQALILVHVCHQKFQDVSQMKSGMNIC